MAEKTSKTDASPKSNPKSSPESSSKTSSKSSPKTDSPKSDAAATSSKADSSTSSEAAPANYSRGEGQKLVTQAYRDNWLAIFGKPARKASKTESAKRKRAAKVGRKTTAKKPKTKSKR